MRVGITGFCLDDTLHPVALARAVEDRGFDSLWLPEHSHIPVSRESPWPGSLTGEPLPDYYWRQQDQFVALAMAAAVTERLLLGTSITLVVQRDPIWLAKQVASLDHLSGGRVLLGVGYGWNREEAENHGADWANRRAIVRERVLAMKALWTEEVAGFDGEFVHVAPSLARPKPVQPGGPKIILGGGWGPKLFASIAEWGDGWMPISARATLAKRLDGLRAACDAVGRDFAEMEFTIMGATDDPDALEQLAAEGIHRAALTLWPAPPDEHLRQLDAWAPLAARFSS
jgi:probable F420-dependent oxidoreductase